MSGLRGTVSGFRRSEYTGDNRCLPCTVVNLAIAVLVCIAVGVVTAASTLASAGVATAVVAFAFCAAVIYLRGYLVPGTPALTKRYFPAWLLSAFGKQTGPALGVRRGLETADASRSPDEIDPAAVLLSVGALEACPDRPDFRLTTAFRTAWYDAIDRIEDRDAYGAMFSILDVDSGRVEVAQSSEDANVRVKVNGEFVGVWPSRAALLADLGAATMLADDYEGWDEIDAHRRSELLGSLRLFIDRCPSCGGTPELGEETVETCCSARDVVVVACPDCGSRLFEAPAD